MEENIFKLYIEILKDSSAPSNRVVRKTAALILIVILFLIYYRHVVLEMEFGEPALTTMMISFIILSWGIIGSVITGGLYEMLIRKLGVQDNNLTPILFIAEWVAAILSPLTLLIFPFSGDGLIM